MKKGVPRFGILDEGRKALIGLHGGKYSLWVFPYQPLKEKVPPEGHTFSPLMASPCEYYAAIFLPLASSTCDVAIRYRLTLPHVQGVCVVCFNPPLRNTPSMCKWMHAEKTGVSSQLPCKAPYILDNRRNIGFLARELIQECTCRNCREASERAKPFDLLWPNSCPRCWPSDTAVFICFVWLRWRLATSAPVVC